MNTRDRIQDLADRVIEMGKRDIKALTEHLEGPPPNARALTPAEHTLWLQRIAAAKTTGYIDPRTSQFVPPEYPPRWWNTPNGPVYASIWSLTRPFVDGWPAEIARYKRTAVRAQEGNDVNASA